MNSDYEPALIKLIKKKRKRRRKREEEDDDDDDVDEKYVPVFVCLYLKGARVSRV
jgi:hypothetical protein